VLGLFAVVNGCISIGASATTLIVSLGILREPGQLAVLMLAVVLLVIQGFVINRLAGIPYPRWALRAAPQGR
jgi:hypothetical protein